MHTAKWIGVTRDGPTLSQPLGSAIGNNVLYVVDINCVRTFDPASGAPRASYEVAEATGATAASMCYDSRQNQLVIPMNNHNAMAFIALGRN